MSAPIRRRPAAAKRRVTMPKPGKARPRRRMRKHPPGRYDPRVPSRGLTVDTEDGPVDLVAVERAEARRGPVSLTPAELTVLVARLAARPAGTRWNGEAILEEVAETIDVDPGVLRRRVFAVRAELRQAMAS